MLVSPDKHQISNALRFQFQASNNEAEYEALIAGLRLAAELRVDNIDVFSDSQLVVNQVSEEFQANDPRMAKYLVIVRAEHARFTLYTISHVAREENKYADSLAKLTTTREAELHNIIPVEHLPSPSIDRDPDVMEIDTEPTWMDPFREYLQSGTLPEN